MKQEVEVSEYLLANGEILKEEIEKDAKEFLSRGEFFRGTDIMPESEFMSHYRDFFCSLLMEGMQYSFPNLTIEDLCCIVTPELVVKLFGEEFFQYED